MNLGEVKNEGVREGILGRINVSDGEFNQFVHMSPGVKGHRKMRMGIFKHICITDCVSPTACLRGRGQNWLFSYIRLLFQ